jgi:bifunctional non-homologous end joining protein LigD
MTAKALNRQEFVILGWSDLEGTRPHLGALLLGYHSDDGKLIYAGRVGTGMLSRCLRICCAAWTRWPARHRL